MTQKGVYPYDYMDSFEKFNETELPTKEEFYSILNNEHITDEDYSHAQKVWNTFHAGPGEGTKLHARKNFCVFYPIELKLCTMIELFIPNNRIVFVFSF